MKQTVMFPFFYAASLNALQFNVMERGQCVIRYWLLQFAGLFFRFAAGVPESSDMDAISLYVID